MMPRISFMSANFVARQVGYPMTGGWAQGDQATNDYFKPLETFAQRFEEILRDIRSLGFTALDLWTAHLHWAWASPEHLVLARHLLDRYQLPVASLAGGFGATREEFEAACRLAVALKTPILGGSTPLVFNDRPFVVATLQHYDLKLGLENHPEKTPEEMLSKIGDGDQGRIGTAVDTGWYATQGYDAAQAVEKLGPHIFHVHLKDVLGPGDHVTCRFGQGRVPLEACVQVLEKMGYRGGYSVEHEPETYHPGEDCRASLALLRGWLNL
jgi:sugar phosphate isomerase/epimerase